MVKKKMLEIALSRTWASIRTKPKHHKSYALAWVDTSKGVDKNRNCRSRLVGRTLKVGSSLDLSAPTPHLEAMTLGVNVWKRAESTSEQKSEDDDD